MQNQREHNVHLPRKTRTLAKGTLAQLLLLLLLLLLVLLLLLSK